MRRQKPQRQYYFSEKLKQRLTRIPFYPLTVVEAPAGFGKTTAVREFLKENLPPDAREFWYTCLGEPAAAAWGGWRTRTVTGLAGNSVASARSAAAFAST